MSLLDGPDTIQVYEDVTYTDVDGNQGRRRPGTTAVPVSGRWEYDDSAEDTAAGQQVTTRATFRTRSFPAGFAGRVEHGGQVWDVIGDPTFHGGSPMVAHVRVRLTSRVPWPVA